MKLVDRGLCDKVFITSAITGAGVRELFAAMSQLFPEQKQTPIAETAVNTATAVTLGCDKVDLNHVRAARLKIFDKGSVSKSNSNNESPEASLTI